MISNTGTAVDAFAHEAAPDANYGTHPYLQLDATTGTRRYAYLYFTRPFPLGATLTRAYLDVRAYTGFGTARTLTVRRITGSWRETGTGALTWNKRPTTDAATATVSVPAGTADGTLIRIDVTSLLQTVAAGGAFYGFEIQASGAVASIHSAEAPTAAWRPRLEVDWSTPPSPPTDLRPAGGRNVAGGQPTLAWSFVDSQGEYQLAYQVQISTSATFATTVHDSGWITSDRWEHALAGTGFTLAAGTLYYWRVRARDSYGMESGWSDVATMNRLAKPTITITAPSGTTVDEVTPTITHTFSGGSGTQAAVEYLVYKQDATTLAWELIWRSGQIATASTSYQLPATLITDTGPYRVEVRVWDTADREATPGDEAYALASKDFSYTPSGTPSAVATLSAAMGAGADGAAVVLTWTRATTPDFFAIRVNGRIVEPRLTPAQAGQNGTTFTYRYWRARPQYAATFEVEAVQIVSGRHLHSTGNPTATITPRPPAQWLIAPGYGLRVAILGRDPLDMRLPENGEVFTPVGRRDAVRIVDAVRGYEGTLSGILADFAGTTAAAWRDTLEQIKGLPVGAEVRLIAADHNFRVALGEAEISPESETAYRVAIPFWQVDDYTFRVRR